LQWSHFSTGSSIPSDLFVLSFSRLYLQTPVIHLVDVSSGLHVAKDVVLQLGHRLEEIRHVLILLNVPDHFSSLGTLVEVDKFGRCQRWNTILDESQIG